MDEQTGKITLEVAKQTVKDIYNDGAKPVVKSFGKTMALIPRAINAVLEPLEKWIQKREYNIEETKKLLEIKLNNINPERIEEPEAYIAVPTIQYISYCIDSKELRNMYANLLANSMDNVVKDEVHPSFVDIIKQLSPDEAKILKALYLNRQLPIVGVRYENETGIEGIDIVKKFSNIGEEVKCEMPYEIEKYLDNLERLGLVTSTLDSFFANESHYDILKCHNEIKKLELIPEEYKEAKLTKFKLKKGVCELTSFGKSFCKLCVLDKEEQKM